MWGQWIGSAKGNINADVILNIDERIKTFGLIELNYTKEPEDNFRPIAMGLHNVTFNGNDFSADVTWVVKASPQSTNVENRIKGMLDADGNLHATMNASIGNIELDLSFQEHEVPLQSKELDWQEFKTYIGSVPYDFVGNPIWIFRGHNDSRYALRTSFHRRNRRTLQSYFNSDVPRLAYYLRPILNRDFDINDKEELISFVAGAAFAGKLPFAVLGLYFVASVVAFVAYALDKSAARNDQWRIPESTLHLFALVGGWPGALAAQKLLRHKSRKQSFQIVFWAAVVLNCGALAWLFSSSGTEALRSILGAA